MQSPIANITRVPSTMLTATIQMRGSKLSKSGFIRRMRSERETRDTETHTHSQRWRAGERAREREGRER